MFCQVFKIKFLLLVGFVQLCSTKFISPFSIQSGLEELFKSNRMTHKVTIYCQVGNLKKKYACTEFCSLTAIFWYLVTYGKKRNSNFMGSVNLVAEHISKSEHVFSTYGYSKVFSPKTPHLKILANIHMITSG